MTSLLFGFNSCFDSINTDDLRKIKRLVTINDATVVKNYESKFVNIIGNGYGFSLASGRMAFYLLLKHLNIGKGDEVIVVGFTCSVMINAILRVGATPVYSDVSPVTFGSDAKKIEEKITLSTRMIVAQHSFGIPCDVEEIVALGKRNNIFVLEDCALAMTSTVKETKVGNFGDAAIFSTDHSKPLNTLIGGFFYTKNKNLFNKLKEYLKDIPELEDNHKRNLFKQLKFEKKWLAPNRYKYLKKINLYYSVRKKVFGKKILFMDGDNGPPNLIKPLYPYPAKLPSFLAQVGIFELDRFEKEEKRRKNILDKYLKIFSETEFINDISKIYFDKDIKIAPLRFVFSSQKAQKVIDSLSSFIDFSQIWFREPIIATSFDLQKFKYKKESCINSEFIGKNIINLPCVIPEEYEDNFFSLLKQHLM